MISRHHVCAIIFAAAAVLPAQLQHGRVRGYHQAAPWAARAADRSEPRDLSYYLEIVTTPAQREKGLAELKRAIAHAEARQNSSALQSFDRAAALLPNLGDWVSLFAASVAATAGDTAEVTRRLEKLDSLLLVDWAWRTHVRAYRNANNDSTAMRLADAAARTPGSPRRRSEAWRAQGEILLLRADTVAAALALSHAIDAWPYSDAALEAARLLSALRGLHPEHHLRIGRTYLRFGNFSRGMGGLNAYLASGVAPPDSAARIRLEMGRAYFDGRDYDRAQDELMHAARAETSVSPLALYLAGRAQYRDGDELAGRRTLHQVVDRYPDQSVSSQALVLLGDLSQDDNETESAQVYFRRATQVAPTSESAGLAHMRLGAIALGQGDYAGAAALLADYRNAFPAGARHQQATYWLGRTQLALDDTLQANANLRKARDLDPFSFYGMRAAETINEAVIHQRLAPDPTSSPVNKQSVDAALLRFDLMRSVGWNEAANFELERMREFFYDEPGAFYALAEGLNQRNRTSVGIAMGRELARREGGTWNRRSLRIVYPLPYRDLIEKHARSRGINPFFMAALIRQESMFNPAATSSVGARGLMQVMPSTGRSLARSLGIRRFNATMLFTPETNLRIGSRFLADQIKSWGGRTDFVLAAYNAGPSRVQRWRQFPEARDADLFLERIPFEETRDYVRIVQLNARIYQTLYGS
ncbi:MAG: transglycosylase SLT domain-containing protein [Longimicrobiales bacterium]